MLAQHSTGTLRPAHRVLEEAASRTPDRIALRDARGALSYAELDRLAVATATWLGEQGVGRGDRVAVRACPVRATVAVFFACLRRGAVFMPFSTDAKRYQLSEVLADAEPALLITDDAGQLGWAACRGVLTGELPASGGTPAAVPAPGGTPAEQPVAVAPDDLALLLYTSGSTAQPKAVVCTHAQVSFAAHAVAESVRYRADDVVFCRLPLSFDYGLYQVLLTFLAGGTLVLADASRDARLLSDVDAHGATVVPVVPSIATILLQLAGRRRPDAPPPRVRLFTNTGEHLSAAQVESLRREFPGAGVQLMFGTTECKRISVLEVDGDRARPGSVGRPIPGTQVRILGEDGRELPPGATGEISVRGPHLMSGYWRAPELTARRYRVEEGTGERYLLTGDFGHLDDEGYLYFAGRKDDVFKLRGTRTSTVEIEAAALALDGVTQAAVLPPGADREAVLCVVATVPPREVLNGLRELLGSLKVPQTCRVVESMPLNVNGKVDRQALRRLVAGDGATSGPAPDRRAVGASRPDVRDLARRYGTPAYHYELDEVDAAARQLRAALPDPATLYYSLKANPHPLIARTLREAGCHAEISSSGELEVARQAGFPGAHCLYTGPGKSTREITLALVAGVRRFSVESAADFAAVAVAARDLGATADCLIRINAPGARGATSLRMSGVASQFGVDPGQPAEHPERFSPRPGARVVGLHFFALSNAATAAAIAEESVANLRLAAWLRDEAGVDLRVVDLGGGFAAPYAQPGDRPDYRDLRPVLETALDEHLPGWRTGDPLVAFESGRYLAGGCGRLVSRVADVKRNRDRTFVVLDGGINHLGGLAGLGRLLPVSAAVLPVGDRTAAGAAVEPATVVGPLCTPADVLARQTTTSALSRGDLVQVPNVGAYGLTASLVGFLSRPIAAEVVLRGGHPLDASRLELGRAPISQEGA
ncbi:AMP-binding protein [Actinosynnema sp. CS-041913]|uniref:AMP-binding protein n=1 Tax=Actinosynnema sp. CS-041913 TaxID=3239917 RepID=UPI003D8D38FE